MADRIDITEIREIVNRQKSSDYTMSTGLFYNLVLKVLLIIADTLIDIKERQ